MSFLKKISLGVVGSVLAIGGGVARAEPEAQAPPGVIRIQITPRPPVAAPAGVTTPAEAMAKSHEYARQVEGFRRQGGWAWKSGLWPRTERSARRWAYIASQMEGPLVEVRVYSVAAEQHLTRARQDERLGGWPWKVGLVRAQMSDVLREEPDQALLPFTTPQYQRMPDNEKPVQRFLNAPPRWQ
jgi:hypothetical protein